MAIDSNKRDRRHSDTIPLLSGDSPNVITTQGMQLINSSPTIPHASGTPYSGSFIVAHGGGIVATPTGQLVQLPQVPGVPIVMPSHHHTRSDSSRTVSEDGDDDNNSPREPPTKKMALEALNQVKVAFSSDSRLPYVHTTAGNFIMTPGGTPIVAHPSMGPPPQFIQMATPHAGHIPIVIPTPTPSTSTPSSLETSTSRIIRGSYADGEMAVSRTSQDIQRKTISVVNGPVPVAAIPPQTSAAVSTLAPQKPGLLTMPGPAQIPNLIMAPPSPGRRKEMETAAEGTKKTSLSDPPAPISTSIKMPFANISIQSGKGCLLYTSPSPRDATLSRMPSSA